MALVKSTSSICWPAVPNTSSYELVITSLVDANADPTAILGTVVSNDSEVSGQELLDTGVSDGTYWLQVRACNSSGCSAYSSALEVDVQATPDIPTGINVC